MEIPKMKILVYVLTFLGYAYSEYGSDLLGNLRDAIVMAENFFGNFLQKAVEMVKNFDPPLLVKNPECKFSCSSGGTPVKNKYHKPSSNGCGTDFLKLEVSAYIPVFNMTDCCNQHDVCYDTCNNLKRNCDDDFKKCLYKICQKVEGVEALIKGCRIAVDMIGSSMTLGCKSYLDSQKRSCYCPSDEKRKKYTPGGEL